MIYKKQFIKETTLMAMAIFVVVLAILLFTQGVNMLDAQPAAWWQLTQWAHSSAFGCWA